MILSRFHLYNICNTLHFHFSRFVLFNPCEHCFFLHFNYLYVCFSFYIQCSPCIFQRFCVDARILKMFFNYNKKQFLWISSLQRFINLLHKKQQEEKRRSQNRLRKSLKSSNIVRTFGATCSSFCSTSSISTCSLSFSG